MYKTLTVLLIFMLLVSCGGSKNETQKKPMTVTFTAVIKTIEPMTVAMIAKKGSYNEIGKTIGELMSWVMANKGNIAGVPFGVYYDDPSKVAAESTRYEICIPVAPETKGDKQIIVKNLPAMEIASTIYIGPYDKVGMTYGKLAGWISEKGYVIAGPPREFYHNNPAQVPVESLKTEIQLPVAKKAEK
jgi:effector-binding domain-containing protein